MRPQDIDTIVRLLREEASEISSEDYARLMMREAATTIVALASELAARDEQISRHKAETVHLAFSVQQMKASTAAARAAVTKHQTAHGAEQRIPDRGHARRRSRGSRPPAARDARVESAGGTSQPTTPTPKPR